MNESDAMQDPNPYAATEVPEPSPGGPQRFDRQRLHLFAFAGTIIAVGVFGAILSWFAPYGPRSASAAPAAWLLTLMLVICIAALVGTVIFAFSSVLSTSFISRGGLTALVTVAGAGTGLSCVAMFFPEPWSLVVGTAVAAVGAFAGACRALENTVDNAELQ